MQVSTLQLSQQALICFLLSFKCTDSPIACVKQVFVTMHCFYGRSVPLILCSRQRKRRTWERVGWYERGGEVDMEIGFRGRKHACGWHTWSLAAPGMKRTDYPSTEMSCLLFSWHNTEKRSDNPGRRRRYGLYSATSFANFNLFSSLFNRAHWSITCVKQVFVIYGLIWTKYLRYVVYHLHTL
jgi:hypothetical protein